MSFIPLCLLGIFYQYFYLSMCLPLFFKIHGSWFFFLSCRTFQQKSKSNMYNNIRINHETTVLRLNSRTLRAPLHCFATIPKLALRVGAMPLIFSFIHICCFEHTHVSSKLNELLAFSISSGRCASSPRNISAADLASLLAAWVTFIIFQTGVMIIFSVKQSLIIPFSLDHSTTTCRKVTFTVTALKCVYVCRHALVFMWVVDSCLITLTLFSKL